jgi:Glycosyl transferase family 11
MITCELLGRLGNHLFQVATTISVAKQLKTSFVIPNTAQAGHHGTISCDLSGFEYHYNFLDTQLPNEFNQKVFHYVPVEAKDDMVLKGFYQSYQYFDSDRDMLLNDFFNFNNKVRAAAYKYPVRDDSLGISIRGGDYFMLQQNHNVLQRDYYQNALSQIAEIDNIFVFSDDFNWVDAMMGDIKKDLIYVNDDKWVQLYMMTQMKHLIMANSTFSWWGGYLNNRGGKIIIPDQWFGPANSHLDTTGLYYPTWTRIK